MSLTNFATKLGYIPIAQPSGFSSTPTNPTPPTAPPRGFSTIPVDPPSPGPLSLFANRLRPAQPSGSTAPMTPPPVTPPPPAQPASPGLSREQIRDLWMSRTGRQTPEQLAAFAQQYGGTVTKPDTVRWDWGGGKVEDLDMIIDTEGKGQAGWGGNAGMLGAAGTQGSSAPDQPRGTSAGPAAGTSAHRPGTSSPALATPDATGGTGNIRSGQGNELYNTLLQRSRQGLNINAQTNPNIRQQADPYAAAVERDRRSYMADTAERLGPLANLQGEERLSRERAGQASGLFESQLVGRELQARRDEIQNALMAMQGMLSQEQQLAMQREIANLDAAISREGLRSREGMQAAQLGSQNDQFLASLGLQAENQNNYWDWTRSGGF